MELDKIKSIPIQSVAQHLGVSNNGSTILKCWNSAVHNNDDANPSLSLDVQTNRYKCFGCEEDGTVIDLVMGYRGVNFSGAVNELAKMVGGDAQTETRKANMSDKKYSMEDITKWKLGGKIYEEHYSYINYIKVRFRDPSNKADKTDIYFTKTKDGKFIKGRNCEPELYNLRALEQRTNNEVCYVEGEPCVNIMKDLGYLSTTAGSATISEKTFTNEMVSSFKDCNVVVFPDNDPSGYKLVNELTKLIHSIAKSVKKANLESTWKTVFNEEMPNKADIKDFVSKYKALHGDSGLKNVIDKMIGDAEDVEEIVTPVTEDWNDIIPFDNYAGLPAFPSHALPDIGRQIVEAVAETNQVDPGLTGSIYLAVLSTCLAKKAIVDLNTHVEPVNLYICPALDSGERKSATISVMAKPLYEYQSRVQDEKTTTINESANRHKIRETRLASLQKKSATATNEHEAKNFQRQASEMASEIMENPVKTVPVYIVDDITPEALGGIMADNNERMSIISAEGGIFGIMAGLYNDKGANFEIFLKGHTGDYWSSHRVGRESKSMAAPCLTMCLTVQHQIIKEIGSNKQFRGRGLLARFLYSYCDSKIGHRPRHNEKISDAVLRSYKAHIYSLMDIPLDNYVLTLSHDAVTAWNEFYNDIEADMRFGNPLSSIKDWGSKLPGAVARIAGLLHYAEHGAEAHNIPISVGIIGDSCAIGAYYREHALAIFGLMGEDPQIQATKHILDYLKQHKPDTFKGREILQNKNAFRCMQDIVPGLNMLIERNYIREIETTSRTGGRPEATTYELNPEIKNM